MATTQQKKFIDLLEEIFQFDHADLDFGIYRIMNQKREEITNFLDNELVPQVKKAFDKYKNADVETIKQQMEELEQKLNEMGVAKDSSEKYLTLNERLNKGVDITALENEVFSDLTNFFRRYYHEGDFLSLRRYKKDVYAIPYEGEEVKLHWANADQYYVKTSEYFRNYTFNLPSGKTVNFKLVEANTELNNNKDQDGKERRFILFDEDPVKEENGEFYIHFEYRPAEGKETQKQLNDSALEILTSLAEYNEWLNELLELSPTEKNKKRTLLEKYLNDYTARNTFDYFIHKDLGGFLRRELDFFIKNEVMHIDDLDTENEKRFEEYLSKVKVIKSIGSKIISFLEQIEGFQKKLWLKRKFIIESNYCITLDNIPEDFYEDIIQNNYQLNEWITLFKIDELDDFTNPINIEFLKKHQYLTLDTKFFNEEFKGKLLSQFDNIDEKINGLLVHSENFQALNLLRKKYENSIRTVYIDPPYNTVHSEILYKNQYKHSSWLTLMANVAKLTSSFFENTFSYGIAIDDYEFVNLASLYDTLFPNFEREVVVVNHHPQGAGGRLSRTHEYFVMYSPVGSPAYLGKPLDDYQEDRSFMRSGTAKNNFRTGRWKSFYALIFDPKTNKIIDAEEPVPLGEKYPTNDTVEGFRRIYPINSKGEERVWRSSFVTGKGRAKNGELSLSEGGTVYQKIDHEGKRELLFSNWTDSKFNAGVHGSNYLRDMGFGGLFDYPKSINTVETALWAQTYGDKEAIVMDYFAGSGTTGEAVINLNRHDDGNRKYILVEMGEYFNSVTKPRLQKATYSKDWKDGKPVSQEGISHIFKYIKLESYEDALNNIELNRSPEQQAAMDEMMSVDAKEEYLLSYMIDVEAEGSPSLLNIEALNNPFDYKMMITEGTETKPTKVDLIETFNYLIGLHVKTIDMIKGIKVIIGVLRNGEDVLILWRNTDEVSNKQLEDFFNKQGYNTRDNEFDRIYVNGDNHLENLKLDEDKWKVILIEEEFRRLMFDVYDV